MSENKDDQSATWLIAASSILILVAICIVAFTASGVSTTITLLFLAAAGIINALACRKIVRRR